MDPPSASTRDAVLKLLDTRANDATVCPSEVARALASGGESTVAGDWRDNMAAVHAAVDQLVSDGLVRLSWKGQHLPVRSGPYRIGHVSS
jgi:hypothetical protein